MSDSVRLLESVKQAAVIRLPNILPETLDSEMRWVMMDFLSATRVWVRDLTLTLVAGTVSYAVDIDDTESAVVLMEAVHNGRVVSLGLRTDYTGAVGAPLVVGLPFDRTLRVFPVPNAEAAAYPLQFKLALTLLPSVNTTPPDELRPFHEALLDGLLSRCYAMNDQPWTNMRLALPHLHKYEGHKSQARRRVESGRTMGARFVRFPRFA